MNEIKGVFSICPFATTIINLESKIWWREPRLYWRKVGSCIKVSNYDIWAAGSVVCTDHSRITELISKVPIQSSVSSKEPPRADHRNPDIGGD